MLKRIKILLFLLIFVSVSFFSIVQAPRAEAYEIWVANYESQMFKELLEEIYQYLRDTALLLAKKIAIKAINETISDIIAGSGLEDALFITNWEDFLVTEPLEKADAYFNSFITQSFRGQNSTSNFSQNGNVGNYGNYATYLAEQGKRLTVTSETPVHNLSEYTPNLQSMFSKNNLRAWSAFHENSMNNIMGATTLSKEAYFGKLAQEYRKSDVKAIAGQGFKDKTAESDSSGVEEEIVTAPARTVGDILQATQQAAAFSVSDAGSAIEVAISSIVNKILSSTIESGIGGGGILGGSVSEWKNAYTNVINQSSGTQDNYFNSY